MVAREHYHHGDLASALRSSALKTIREEGLARFSLRSIARGLGVDVSAAYRHYRSKGALLGAVAAEGFALLGARMLDERAGAQTATERFMAVGKAYVDFALDEPNLFRLMFGSEGGPSEGGPTRGETSPYALLLESLAELDEAHGCVESVDASATLAWSAVHGLASLAVDGRLTPEQTRQSTPVLLRGVTRGLIRFPAIPPGGRP